LSTFTRAQGIGSAFRKPVEWSPHLVPLATANRRLCISRQNSYRLIGRGEYPVEVLRVGHRWFVRVADIDALTRRP
jgi:hypothetical protein